MSGGVTGEDLAALKLRADDGDVDAMRAVGFQLRNSDRAQAAVWWGRAAELGDPRSMFNLGLLVEEEDREEARRWYGQAAELGDRASMVKLGDLAADESPQEAETWWERAASAYLEVGNANANVVDATEMCRLGVTYFDRIPDTAIRLFESAAQVAEREGHEETLRDALHNLALLLLDTNP